MPLDILQYPPAWEGKRVEEPIVYPVAAYVDSNSEDSDSDASDVGEVDSDIEMEKQQNYSRSVYKEDMVALRKQMKSNMAPGEKRSKAPNQGLVLQFVHG